ncbi:type I secretion system permease/ATPase [Vandammella animalimorsus]|uniref:Cyclolysin secretion/processing ATP-binding protein CyaB n=1 Tax=Vandammella animalimorsus TaxID=2029117 RepID=A0A2A2ATK7_9BURK|nr:type I secretion system permease/ATPase [Vandammella animalimorsus]PAT41920.1 type I secretion system permease/ATPase [Vandammella animalimorsus]
MHASSPSASAAPAAPADDALQCLELVAQLHHMPLDRAQLRHQFGAVADVRTLLLAAQAVGFKARRHRLRPERLPFIPLPAICPAADGRFFVWARTALAPAASAQAEQATAAPPGLAGAAGAAGLRMLVQWPGQAPQVLTQQEFLALGTGEAVLLTSRASYAGELARFDFSWFIPALVKYRGLLGEVLLVSLVLQLVALVTPLFFQVVMDKVLVNHAMQTLNVVAVGLLLATVFEVLLGAIRTYVVAHTSSKMDVELGARLFRHLLGLPMAYFQSRRVGDSVARVRELESIRAFLTSQAMTVLLDGLFSVVFLAVMLWYSVDLTLVVLASIPVYFLLSLFFTPILRARLNEKFNRGAENQAFLVESIAGVNTIKAMAVEPRWQERWDRQLAGYVSASLSTANIANLAGNSVMLVSKLVTVGILWIGARQVLQGQLTVGQLIAFNMLAGQVAAPIIRLAQLWNDFQQVGISMVRLGDILNTPTELAGAQRTRLPRLAGAIEFDQVSFRYRPDAAQVLRGVSLKVAPGEVIGIVGRSGSGKSTLTRLAQRLYVPERGRVLVDGQDIAIADTASLRHQIGVVLQENVLFNRSVRENIALADPACPIEAVMAAARLAGAHDFICELPEGYDTQVGEHGANLSGGQRQRIAIARALLGDPRVLIFDEATSALDYESERIIQDNMQQICQGRTVLIIAHRLSAVRHADRIVVMERGEIAEIGPHEQLLQNPQGIYTHLYRLQQGPAPGDKASAGPDGVPDARSDDGPGGLPGARPAAGKAAPASAPPGLPPNETESTATNASENAAAQAAQRVVVLRRGNSAPPPGGPEGAP